MLAYGFSPDEEERLDHHRQNIYDFVRYAARHNIPLILPHPLYFYTKNEKSILVCLKNSPFFLNALKCLTGNVICGNRSLL
ncbi:MAG: hypothetical protein R3D86_13565 [Emcibacteraceae bacterium]